MVLRFSISRSCSAVEMAKAAVNKGAAAAKAKTKSAKAKAKLVSDKTRSVEKQVERLVSQHMKGWSSPDLCSLYNGKSAIQRIHDKVTECRQQAARIGEDWFVELRRAHRNRADQPGCLAISDNSQIVHPLLDKGMTELQETNTHKKTLESLDMFFRVAKTLNQKEMILVCELTLDPALPNKRKGMQLIMSAFRMLNRLEAKNSFPDEVKACKSDWDKMWARYYHRFSRSLSLKNLWSPDFVRMKLF